MNTFTLLFCRRHFICW